MVEVMTLTSWDVAKEGHMFILLRPVHQSINPERFGQNHKNWGQQRWD